MDWRINSVIPEHIPIGTDLEYDESGTNIITGSAAELTVFTLVLSA